MATIFTDVGETVVADLVDGTSSTHLDGTNARLAWGTGAGTAAKGDTTLFTEASESRVVATISQPTADKNQWVATITADGTKTITNAGVFDAAAAGNLVIHGDFSGIALVLNDSIEFTASLEYT